MMFLLATLYAVAAVTVFDHLWPPPIRFRESGV